MLLIKKMQMREGHNAIFFFVTQNKIQALDFIKLYYLSKFGLRRKPVN